MPKPGPFGWTSRRERPVPQMSEADREALSKEVRLLLVTGRKVEAVILVREHHHSVGLREAKDFVDAIEQEAKQGL